MKVFIIFDADTAPGAAAYAPGEPPRKPAKGFKWASHGHLAARHPIEPDPCELWSNVTLAQVAVASP